MSKTIVDAVHEYQHNVSCLKSCFKKESTYFLQFVSFFKQSKVEYLRSIETKHADFLQNHLLKTRKASTVNRQFTTYCHFFKKCVEWGYLKESPFRFYKKKKEQEPDRLLWDEKNISLVLKHSPKWFRACFLFLSLTGARPVELCGLMTSDVFLDSDSIRLKSDKMAKGFRIVPISQPVAKLLKHLCKNRTGFVFRGAHGGKLQTEHLTKTLKRIQLRHGLQRIPLYSLRHTYATNLCKRDVNIEKVRVLLGHSQIRTTQKYLKVDFFDLKKIVNGV